MIKKIPPAQNTQLSFFKFLGGHCIYRTLNKPDKSGTRSF